MEVSLAPFLFSEFIALLPVGEEVELGRQDCQECS